MSEDPQPPASPGASPSEGEWLNDPDIPFWKPGWGDYVKHLGWRWVVVLPAVGIIVAVLLLPWWMARLWAIWLGLAKFILLALALPISVIAWAMKKSVRERKDPFCIHCGYTLTGLPDHYQCPECGRPFSFRLIEEYRRDPDWFIQRCRRQRKQGAGDVPFAAGEVRRKKSRDGT